MKRRRALKHLGLAGVSAVGVATAVGFTRGVRFPVLQYEPAWAVTQGKLSGDVDLYCSGATLLGAESNHQPRVVKASAPQPVIDLQARQKTRVEFVIQNIHPSAILQSNQSNFSDNGHGLTRTVTGTVNAGELTQLTWKMPETNNFRVAIIGDTGGGRELSWCLQRGKELGAHFLLHLGDIYYESSDILTAPKILEDSPLPVYVAIGNHDFHDDLHFLHRNFTQTIGPRNSSFRLSNIRFVNIDTAAAILPVSAGERGALFQSTIAEAQSDAKAEHYVFFTHMPITDPRALQDPTYSHGVPNREHSWLREQLASSHGRTLLAGHVHMSAEFDDRGIHTWVAGEGLAHRDIAAKTQLAQLLLADIDGSSPIEFKWAALDMPLNIHCNKRIMRAAEVDGDDEQTMPVCDVDNQR